MKLHGAVCEFMHVFLGRRPPYSSYVHSGWFCPWWLSFVPEPTLHPYRDSNHLHCQDQPRALTGCLCPGGEHGPSASCRIQGNASSAAHEAWPLCCHHNTGYVFTGARWTVTFPVHPLRLGLNAHSAHGESSAGGMRAAGASPAGGTPP